MWVWDVPTAEAPRVRDFKQTSLSPTQGTPEVSLSEIPFVRKLSKEFSANGRCLSSACVPTSRSRAVGFAWTWHRGRLFRVFWGLGLRVYDKYAAFKELQGELLTRWCQVHEHDPQDRRFCFSFVYDETCMHEAPLHSGIENRSGAANFGCRVASSSPSSACNSRRWLGHHPTHACMPLAGWL